MEANLLKTQKHRLVSLAQSGMIAALYVALTALLQPIGFGPVQCRLAEALTILPVYLPSAVPGLTLGCFLSNLVGLTAGINPAGAWDLLFGTAATGLAAVLSYCWRNVRVGGLPVLSTLPPIIINALVVGTELYVVYGGMSLLIHIVFVAAGQTIACLLGGLVLATALQKSGLAERL